MPDAAAAPGRTQEREPLRVLLVDDDRAVGELLVRMLRRLGHLPSMCSSCEAALATLGELPFDLVVTDLVLPGGSGLELARQLQRLRPGLPVVLTTGLASADQAAEAQQLGVRALLQKPFTMAALTAAVRRATRGDGCPDGAGGGAVQRTS